MKNNSSNEAFGDEIVKRLPFILLNRNINGKSPEQDWQKLITLLSFHGLIPLFFEFYPKKEDLIPSIYLEKIKNIYLKITFKNLEKISLQKELDGLFISNNTRFLYLKGTNLSEILYDKATTRPLLDIDILVGHNDIDKAYRLLKEKGAKPTKIVQNNYIQNLTSQRTPLLYKNVVIELHEAIISQKLDSFPNQSLFKYNNNVISLEPKIYLCYLCSHAYEHFITGKLKLLWFVDIAFFIKKYFNTKEAFRNLLEYSKKRDIKGDVVQVLYLVHKYFLNQPVNELVKNENIEDDIDNDFLKLIRSSSVILNPQYYKNTFSKLEFSDKVKYVGSILFPSLIYIKHRFKIKHTFIAILFLITNPVRVIFKALKTIFKI